MAKITYYPEVTEVADDDVLLVDGEQGTRTITAENLSADLEKKTGIREDMQNLLNRLNALADSDDETLDQLSEIVAFIKDNRDFIRELQNNAGAGGITEEDLQSALVPYLKKTDADDKYFVKNQTNNTTGEINITGADKGVYLKNPDDGSTMLSFHLGTGKTNRGIYNQKTYSWVLHVNENNNICFGQDVLKIYPTSKSITAHNSNYNVIDANLEERGFHLYTNNDTRVLSLIQGISKTQGLYSPVQKKWLIGYQSDNQLIIDGGIIKISSSGIRFSTPLTANVGNVGFRLMGQNGNPTMELMFDTGTMNRGLWNWSINGWDFYVDSSNKIHIGNDDIVLERKGRIYINRDATIQGNLVVQGTINGQKI